jgi:hypothetical protein
MNEIEFEKLIHESWRRKLTPEEEGALRAYFATRAELQAEWERDSALNQLLVSLRNAPVATNFTSRVLLVVAQHDRESQRNRGSFFHWPRLSLLPRIAIGSAFVCAAVFSVQQYRSVQRTQFAHDIAAVSQAATVPQEWLEDFEAIRHLSQPRVDNELLAALQ